MAKTQIKAEVFTDASFTLEQYLGSSRFTAQEKDILRALLTDGESYTPEQVDAIVEEFLKKEVQ